MYHTNPTQADTDGDGLSDYDEMAVLGTDPSNTDTEENGVLDCNEDADNDGLSNIQEIRDYKTLPISADTDGDGLSDQDEVFTHFTDPTMADTDGDGKNDGWELENDYNPLVPNTNFPEDAVVLPDYVGVEAEGDVIVTQLEDDFLINENTPGYIGVDPIHVELAEGQSANIALKFDPAMLDDGEEPALYYFCESTQSYEKIPSQITDGTVTAPITKSAVYVLLNHRFVEDVWINDIFKPSETVNDGAIDMVFVIDRSKSMDDNDPNDIRKLVTKEFIGKLRDGKDQAAVVQFNAIGEVVMQLTGDKEALYNAVDMIENSDGGGCAGSDSNAGTNGSAGIRQALNLLEGSEARYRYIIFLTDGEDTTVSEDYGDEYGTYGLTGEARQKNIIIHTVGLVGTGAVDTDLLKRVAKGTGGNYYLATVGEDAEQNSELVEIYDEIEAVTIDRLTDSNDDGISDYYTRMICDGKLGTGTGIRDLFNGADYDTIQENKDLDGDGLTNGQELEIIENERGVFVQVHCLPYTADSDKDGLPDAMELNGTTNPMKKNGNVKFADVQWLTNSENFMADVYLDYYNGQPLERGAVWIGNAFFGTVLDQSNLYRQMLVNYFYTIDQTLLSSASDATFDRYAEAYLDALFEGMTEELVLLADSGDTDELENSLLHIKNWVENLQQNQDFINSSIDTADKLLDQKNHQASFE